MRASTSRGGHSPAAGLISADADSAAAALYRTYRPAVVAYLRRHGAPPGEAEDLAQAFFEQLILRHACERAELHGGHVHAFLRVALRRYLAKQHAGSRAAKRGNGLPASVLDFDPIDPLMPTPEQAYERGCALASISQALARMQDEADAAGKHDLFETLAEFLVEPPDADDYQRLAQRLQLRRNTLAVTVYRWRGRLRELVREAGGDATEPACPSFSPGPSTPALRTDPGLPTNGDANPPPTVPVR